MSEQERVRAKTIELRAKWEDAKANQAPHIASHTGIDLLISFLFDLVGGDSFEEDGVQNKDRGQQIPVAASDVPGGLPSDTKLPPTLTEAQGEKSNG